MAVRPTVARTPELYAGEGVFDLFPRLVAERGWRRIFLCTGMSSFDGLEPVQEALREIERNGVEWERYPIHGEPSPQVVDEGVRRAREMGAEVVVAVGGGSVLDTGKAVSAGLFLEGSVKDYLEGVGTKFPTGERLPLVAVPTTAGTGSEATSNAVLSEVGPSGYKRSLRHPGYVPDAAFLDPLLHLSCPPSITAAAGMDAISQLVEAFLSTEANPASDALALQGLVLAGRSFLVVVREGGRKVDARLEMAYAAYFSGVCLTSAGLGLVHGLASPMGARFPVSHGLLCANLLPEVMEATVRVLEREGHSSLLTRCALAGEALSGRRPTGTSPPSLLPATLYALREQAGIPSLSGCGITPEDARALAASASHKAHPCIIPREEIASIIISRI
ncbi:iron-containing alcohol dehydrogenase [Spirochaeta thermophila DSM 6578]|uniref:Iron-containing alcohol dehydrogenase n=1 Tax=Winmispira thermophila (strain ATCC 700085 / DSM 6578 / Z-1203) TaxID=869211 RepID=G0GCL5_WINT7|nr:iron-containing alcohol dehydrogenase [Spirochaeta thermophila]AEJ62081.1 iron-containing alcohol dehydrogenase [Spirochaeta thermophila DSM 6578]